jgi:hypothetical protein
VPESGGGRRGRFFAIRKWAFLFIIREWALLFTTCRSFYGYFMRSTGLDDPSDRVAGLLCAVGD